MQKRSFCSVIPIELHDKDYRISTQNAWICTAKAVVLGQNEQFFV